jgi:hypothetical protein
LINGKATISLINLDNQEIDDNKTTTSQRNAKETEQVLAQLSFRCLFETKFYHHHQRFRRPPTINSTLPALFTIIIIIQSALQYPPQKFFMH